MEIKCQIDAIEVFIADLIACSTCFGHHYAHHQELKSIIQWLLRVVFCDFSSFSNPTSRNQPWLISAPDDGHSDARNMLSKQ